SLPQRRLGPWLRVRGVARPHPLRLRRAGAAAARRRDPSGKRTLAAPHHPPWLRRRRLARCLRQAPAPLHAEATECRILVGATGGSPAVQPGGWAADPP